MTVTRARPRLITYLDGSKHLVDEVGGKAAGIDLLLRHHYPVPRAAVITTAAYRATVAADKLDLLIRDLRSSALPAPDRIEAEAAAIERTFLSASIPDVVTAAIDRIGAEMLRRGRLAVRSSATAEDLAEASFAGQYLTVTGVSSINGLHDAVRRCWASLWLPPARAYRRRHHLSEHHVAMAVIVQAMVDPQWSGVAFTRDPQSEGHLMRIEAVPGLGEDLVSGRVTPADFLVRRDTLEIIPAPGASHLGFIEDLARLSLRIEQTIGKPQDIEWAVTEEGITLLQVRPITEPARPLGTDDGLDTPEPADHTFTPHGVVEMVPGVVSPLLWTINAPMLENAFRTTFADLGGTPPAEDLPLVTRFRGRAALDLTAICRIASSLPGGDPVEVERQYLGAPLSEDPGSHRSRAHLFAAMRSRRVHNRIVDEVDLTATSADGLARMQIDLANMPVRRLVAYRQRIRDLAWRGYAAEVGASSAAGATYRALELLLERWLPADQASSWAQLLTRGALDLSPVGGARAKPLHRVLDRYGDLEIRALISAANADPRSSIAGLGEAGGTFLEALDREVRAMGSKAIYGDDTWEEDEVWVWRQLQLLVNGEARGIGRASWTEDFASLRSHLATSKRWRLTRIITGQVVDLRLRWLQRQIQETIRFLELRERAKNALLVLGGEERRIIVEAARRLVASGQLPNPDAVRFLTDAELERMLFGLCGIGNDELDKRRRINHNCATAGPLPDWFVGRPSVHREVESASSETLQGWAASPGRYTGPVRIITSLADGARLQPGEVLVAHSTDPSWTPLFLIASAVVLEVGGPLSHAAIVAREFGLPAVLNVRGSTGALAEGETVTVDGNEGCVERYDGRSAS